MYEQMDNQLRIDKEHYEAAHTCNDFLPCYALTDLPSFAKDFYHTMLILKDLYIQPPTLLAG